MISSSNCLSRFKRRYRSRFSKTRRICFCSSLKIQIRDLKCRLKLSKICLAPYVVKYTFQARVSTICKKRSTPYALWNKVLSKFSTNTTTPWSISSKAASSANSRFYLTYTQDFTIGRLKTKGIKLKLFCLLLTKKCFLIRLLKKRIIGLLSTILIWRSRSTDTTDACKN